jgi:hypothetical protein
MLYPLPHVGELHCLALCYTPPPLPSLPHTRYPLPHLYPLPIASSLPFTHCLCLVYVFTLYPLPLPHVNPLPTASTSAHCLYQARVYPLPAASDMCFPASTHYLVPRVYPLPCVSPLPLPHIYPLPIASICLYPYPAYLPFTHCLCLCQAYGLHYLYPLHMLTLYPLPLRRVYLFYPLPLYPLPIASLLCLPIASSSCLPFTHCLCVFSLARAHCLCLVFILYPFASIRNCFVIMCAATSL